MYIFPEDNLSEVARLRARIEAEEQSMQLMRSGLMYGTAYHAFITARMERIAAGLAERKDEVGRDQAVREAWAAMDTFAEEVAALPQKHEAQSPTQPQETEQTKPEHKGRLWLYIVNMGSERLKIGQMTQVYAATLEDAIVLTASWREKKIQEGYSDDYSVKRYPRGFTYVTTTLPGYINADGSTA
jgi:hypothetical protein